jgi:hypothetical protein
LYSHFSSTRGTTFWSFLTFDRVSFDSYPSIKHLVCKVFPTKCTNTHEQTLANLITKLRKCHWWNWNGCKIIVTTFNLIKVHVLNENKRSQSDNHFCTTFKMWDKLFIHTRNLSIGLEGKYIGLSRFRQK